MPNEWKINTVTGAAEHSSGLKCGLEKDRIRHNGLVVSFKNAWSWEHQQDDLGEPSNKDDLMKRLGEQYIELVKNNVKRYENVDIRLYTESEINILKNRDRYYQRKLEQSVAKSVGRARYEKD